MDEPLSKLEQLLIQMTEWKAKFLHEREWRENIEREKKALDEKYVQIVFELGTQKRALEDLEARVKLLTAQNENTLPQHQQEETAPLKARPDTAEPKHPDEQAEPPQGHKSSARHHIYTNPAIYESSAFNLRPSAYRGTGANAEEPAPYIFHRYQPDGLDKMLDDEIASLQEELSDLDRSQN